MHESDHIYLFIEYPLHLFLAINYLRHNFKRNAKNTRAKKIVLAKRWEYSNDKELTTVITVLSTVGCYHFEFMFVCY